MNSWKPTLWVGYLKYTKEKKERKQIIIKLLFISRLFFWEGVLFYFYYYSASFYNYLLWLILTACEPVCFMPKSYGIVQIVHLY